MVIYCLEIALEIVQSSPPESGRHFPGLEIVLRWNAKSIGNSIEKSEHGGNVNRFRDLILAPACVAKLLNVFGSGTISGAGDLPDVVQQ